MQQTFLVSKTYQDEVELDSFSAGCTRMGYVSGVDGDGTLATVSFTVQTKGATPLDLYDTKLRSGGLNPIEHNVEDALFTTGIPRASFTFSPPIARINQTVEFDATESTDDGSIVSYNWDFGDGEVASETDPLTSHAYGEGGTYIVLLTVTDNDLLNGTAMRDVKVRYPHDIMVTAVSASPHHVIAGETVTITVTVMNDGTEAESSLNVKVKYDDSEIGSPQSVSNLAAGENKTLTFSWNTAGVPKDTYRIKAEASLVLGELDELDNLKLGNTVEVKEPAPFPWTTVVGGSFLVAVFGICVFFLMKRRGKAPAPL